jgi:hypothetical protein
VILVFKHCGKKRFTSLTKGLRYLPNRKTGKILVWLRPTHSIVVEFTSQERPFLECRLELVVFSAKGSPAGGDEKRPFR